MRLPGECVDCGRFLYVRASNAELALASTLRRPARGVCVKCERDRETERERWRVA